jgi:YD repeat-containing protein
VTLTATASDNVGVAGVQFLVDGTPLAAEDTAAPYSASWNTTTATNGTHTLTALARDAAGNTTTSTVTVTVDTPDGTSVTIGRSTLVLPDSNGHAVNVTWYFPNHDDAPVGLIYLQHGNARSDVNLSALAQQLADRTNSIVVSPTVSTIPWDRYYIMNDPIERAVAALFVGDRSELTASAAAAAGHPVTLPQQFVLAGHSAGGNLVAAAAGYIADAGAAGNLKGVILFDAAHDGDASTGMAKLSGENAVPVMLIAAPPCSCNNSGANTNTTINSAPDKFVAVMLAGGSHLDAEGSSTDSLGILGCGPAATPQNAAAVQTITAAWINDVFTGSQTGIYAPAGTVVAVDGATATVLAVKGLLLSQSATTA